MKELKIIDKYQSPNFDLRTSAIDTIVIHYTDMKTEEEAINRLCDPSFKVSAHYLISRKGLIYRLVEEEKRAWHAGDSYWLGKSKLNDNSIGIELDNQGHQFGYVDFTEDQMSSLIALCKIIIDRYQIKPFNIVGHSDIAPSRKKDPGELFNWNLLAQQGISLYHDFPVKENSQVLFNEKDKGLLEIQQKLAILGYQVNDSDIFDEQTSDAIIAFKRRFVQYNLVNNWDISCQEILDYLYYKVVSL